MGRRAGRQGLQGGQVSVVPEVVWELDALVGEGPIWLSDEQAVRFVDIKRGKLHKFVPATGARETLEVGGLPSFIVPAADGGLLVGSELAVHRLEQDRLGTEVVTLDERSGNRVNDATVDGSGRLWLGTMDNAETEPTGWIWCLYRGQLHRYWGKAVVTNGPAASIGDRWLYVTDSVARTIWRFPLGPDPVLGGGEVFVQLSEQEGHPDGIVVDSEDCLWVGLWEGWGVRRYAPDGKLLLHVPFPCARVTKVAFGGPDLKTAYVTTACIGLDQSGREQQPLAGSLFAFPPPAPGRVLPAVNLG
ncbi:MAG: SMP-30/gluconolactonase/LRE family protein [Novosphingobium sp.]|nr:SMP-30/gluconolactonase/LRE family protein [Novosphingobium sp.]